MKVIERYEKCPVFKLFACVCGSALNFAERIPIGAAFTLEVDCLYVSFSLYLKTLTAAKELYFFHCLYFQRSNKCKTTQLWPLFFFIDLSKEKPLKFIFTTK